MKKEIKYVTLIFVLLLLIICPGCEKSDTGDNIISRYSIQGKWLLRSERIIKYTSSEKIKDTTYIYDNMILEIDSSDICIIYSNNDDFKLSFGFSFIEPDILEFSSCPLEFICDPMSYMIPYKIIEFDNNKKMILRRTEQNTRMLEDETEYLVSDTIVRAYLRL